MDAFDFAAQPGVERDAVLELACCDFVEHKQNVVLIGGIGTGKTHLAIALGVACCQTERRVRFLTAAEAANEVAEAKAQGRLSRELEQLARFDLLVLDELGYVPFDRKDADLLFGLVTKVYERTSNFWFRGTGIELRNASLYHENGTFLAVMSDKSDIGFGPLATVPITFTEPGDYELLAYVKFHVYADMRIGFLPVKFVEIESIRTSSWQSPP